MVRYAFLFLLAGWVAWCSEASPTTLGERKRRLSEPASAQLVGGPMPKVSAGLQTILANSIDSHLSTPVQRPPAPTTSVPEPSIDSLAREIFSDEIADLFAASSGKDGDDVPLPIPSDNHCDATAAQLVLGKLYAQAANCQSPVAASAPEHELLQSPKSLSLDRNAPLPMSAEPNFPERMAAAAEKAVDQTFARKNHYNPLSHNTAPDQEMALVTQYLELQQGKTTAMDPSAMDLPVRVQRNLKVAIETVEVYLQHESGQHEPMPFIPATRRLIEYEYQYETTRYELQIKLNKACLDRSSSDGSQASQDSMSDDQILNSMVYSLQTHFDALLAQLPPNAATQLISHGSLDEYQVKPSAKTFWPITEAMRQNYGLLYMFWNGETKRFELDIFLAPFESKRGRCTKVVQILRDQYVAFAILAWPLKWDIKIYRKAHCEVTKYMAKKMAQFMVAS